MKRQLVTSMGSLSIVIAAVLLAPASAAEQPGAVPRLADGHPDLQGVWDKGFQDLELVKRASLCGVGTCVCRCGGDIRERIHITLDSYIDFIESGPGNVHLII
mgnify:CR=1 FL=1